MIKQHVIINKETGAIGLGIKVNFHDNWAEHKTAAKLFEENEEYSIGFRQSKNDGWVIFSGDAGADGPWLFMNSQPLDELIEVLGEL